MIILIPLVILVIAGCLILKYGTYETEFWGGALAIGAGIVLIIALIMLPITRMESRAAIKQFESVQVTVDAARTQGIPLESQAIQIKVAEMNEWLASAQYWRGTIFRIWLVEEIETLEPIH